MKTWSTKDKSSWKDGEWKSEPDKALWIDKDTGLDCLIVRAPHGALCGYVGVPDSNKWFESDYDDVESGEYECIDVHGGLTFAGKCQPTEDESTGVCHSGTVANETVWWFGFDCAHSGDVCPAYEGYEGQYDSYKNVAYVKRQVENLARQLIG